MAFRRGFKSQCERRSVELRKLLGLCKSAPLSAKRLAEHLGVTVCSVDDFSGLDSKDRQVLVDPLDDSWAALTLRIGTENLVVFKPVPSCGRKNSVIMHELAHIVLGHELASACIASDGSLMPWNFDQDQEDEADWLAGALLLPRPALVSIRFRGLSDESACERYKVSRGMLTWRMRMTGVKFQLASGQR